NYVGDLINNHVSNILKLLKFICCGSNISSCELNSFEQEINLLEPYFEKKIRLKYTKNKFAQGKTYSIEFFNSGKNKIICFNFFFNTRLSKSYFELKILINLIKLNILYFYFSGLFPYVTKNFLVSKFQLIQEYFMKCLRFLKLSLSDQ
ncbi:hypothetical protein BpHYR1_043637, partial [Brachionus plicatilis]